MKKVRATVATGSIPIEPCRGRDETRPVCTRHESPSLGKRRGPIGKRPASSATSPGPTEIGSVQTKPRPVPDEIEPCPVATCPVPSAHRSMSIARRSMPNAHEQVWTRQEQPPDERRRFGAAKSSSSALRRRVPLRKLCTLTGDAHRPGVTRRRALTTSKVSRAPPDRSRMCCRHAIVTA